MIDISTSERLYGLTPPEYKPEKDPGYCRGCIYEDMDYCHILQVEINEYTQDTCETEGRRHLKNER